MNIWIIIAVAAVLLIAALAGVTALSEIGKAEKISCSGCNNSCTAEKNCGLQTCGAVSGGECGCGR